MRAFETLTLRGQLGRLRRLAVEALATYEFRPARLVALGHEENTTFRVETPEGERYMLRIQRTTGSPFHPPRSADEVRSETMWITAVRRATALEVPEPVLAHDGSPITIVEVEGVPGPRVCVLFRWQPGRFLDAGLTPSHLERVGELMARLHSHAVGFATPAGFSRWRIENVSGDVAAYVAGVVGEQCGQGAASLVEVVMEMVRQADRELGTGPDVFGLIHSDLHQENYLFHRGRVRAIDFDDCGWGHFVYDLAVTLSELQHLTDSAALGAGLLRGYRAVRPLPTEHERYVEVFQALRVLKLTVWFIEQRDRPGFAEWEADVRDGLAGLQKIADRVASAS
jgi:Ser/Thr protein kinase RdoA (MazF antagonist)